MWCLYTVDTNESVTAVISIASVYSSSSLYVCFLAGKLVQCIFHQGFVPSTVLNVLKNKNKHKTDVHRQWGNIEIFVLMFAF